MFSDSSNIRQGPVTGVCDVNESAGLNNNDMLSR
jgi:hypothetical protein